LLLYFFIATPVRFWHHHTFSNSEKTTATKIGKAVIGNPTEECTICQHIYTAYIHDNSCYDICIVNLFSDVKSFQDISFPFSFIDCASNKGPPQI
jgi:hypothetical protein